MSKMKKKNRVGIIHRLGCTIVRHRFGRVIVQGYYPNRQSVYDAIQNGKTYSTRGR